MGSKREVNELIETMMSQAKTVMNETDVPVDERIQKTADIYRQAENIAKEGGLDDKIYESLLSHSAKFFSYYGLYKEGLSRYTDLIALCESLYGQEHPATASAYHCIGETLRDLCDYSKALEYNMKALEIRKKILGEKHVDIADSYNDTGIIYIYQGHYDKASELFQKAKAICEEAVGVNHPAMADTYSNIGMLFSKQEDYAKSLENYLESLRIYQNTLGDEHRRTAISYHGVGMAYYQMGNNSNALEYCSKALNIYGNVMGKNHPEMACIYIGIGYVHYNIGGLSQALEYFTKALEISEKTLGCDHIYIAYSNCALGWAKYKADEKQEAIDCFEKSLNITEKIFGFEHPDTAESYNIIGLIYYLIDENVKAYEYFTNALGIFKKFPKSEYFDRKINEIQNIMDLIEVKDEEDCKGTRDLFLDTLTKIGCQYEFGEGDDDRIFFAFQGEHFFVSAHNDWQYIQIWDTYWWQVELYDIDEFARLKKTINRSNMNNSVMTVYTIDEEGKNVDVHCKSIILFVSQIPELENYLRLELNEFFRAHQFVGNEMAKLREQEGNNQISN